ncbi:unnamed protein product [Brachionus calyciflorus]|uniref:Autocrine proliferation repressor A-like n=1 Tax=Brachionus calyciflorus TaxID=104777 RepID=A0A814BU21_9BILA|nr:unnamed protein product [Brachionus calyciflorus]
MKLFCLIGFFLTICLNYKVTSTPIDDYVNTPDPFYSYNLIKTYSEPGYKLYVLNMTSQKWLNESFVNRPIWWHYLSITVPDKIKKQDVALLWIGEGSNQNRLPKPSDYDVLLTSNFSLSTETITALIQQVPNQPIIFKDDPLKKERSEDALIAWGWKKFMDDTSNPEILLRLPMAKAVSRSMDTVQDFVKKNHMIEIKKFMVTGKSKRGWSAWISAAIDSRVFTVVPIVMDLLNLNTNLHQNFKATGGWTFAFKDYYEVNITGFMDTRAIFEMQKIIDPLYYLERYKNINILVISTTSDEFFYPDNTYTYWDNLVAATDGKLLHRRIPNVGHSVLTIGDALLSSLRGFFLSSYYQAVFMPKLSWSMPNNSTHGVLTATVDLGLDFLKPFSVRCWYAQTRDNVRRDFRQTYLSPNGLPTFRPLNWTSTQSGIHIYKNEDKIKYTIAFERKTNGWFGFFLEFYFPGLQGSTNIVTTETNIIPEFYPFEDCTRSSCIGRLV